MGRLFGFCVKKNAELAPDNPARKFKYRSVFEGNHVRTAIAEQAVFQELSSSPATTEASKPNDFHGLLPDNESQVADAVQAYTQATLKGTETWVRLPRDQWLPGWDKMKDPVVRLVLALYGHPDSEGALGKALRRSLAQYWFCQHLKLEVLLLASNVQNASQRVRG